MRTRDFFIYALTFIAVSILMLFSGCEPEELDTTSKEAFIGSLAQTWTVGEDSYILIENDDITHLLMGFEMSITSDLDYVTNSGQLALEEFPWPVSGSFTLNDELTELVRDDGMVISLNLEEEEESLVLDFKVGENTAGRTLGIKGGWKCKFKKKP